MSEIKLSICIPTFNRARFLPELLDSIHAAGKDYLSQIEIALADNASEDETQDLVKKYQGLFPNFTYFRWDENQGADRNYLKSVEIAHGEFFWLMGSDDVIRPDAIQFLLKKISETPENDMYLLNRLECSFDMTPKKVRSWFSVPDAFYNTGKKEDLIKYFDQSNSLGAIFSFLGSIVCRRAQWQIDSSTNDFVGSAYVHSYVLMQAVKRGLLIQCVSEALVLCRGENDSFVSNGILRRIFIDFDGYIRIAHQVFPEDKEVQAALIGVLKREHPFRRLIKIEVLKHKDYKQYEQLRQHLRVVGWREIDFLCARCLQGLYSMYSLLKKRK